MPCLAHGPYAPRAQALYERLENDYLILLPETVPFLAELMEDGDEEVEQQCQLLVKRIERLLGHSLRRYM